MKKILKKLKDVYFAITGFTLVFFIPISLVCLCLDSILLKICYLILTLNIIVILIIDFILKIKAAWNYDNEIRKETHDIFKEDFPEFKTVISIREDYNK